MKYITSALNGLVNVTIFKSNLIISIFSRIVQVCLAILTWNAIYDGSNHRYIGGYSRPEMFKYLILTSLLFLLFTMEPVFNLSKRVKDGTISAWIIRPISINLESLSTFVGSKILFICIMIVYLLAVGGSYVSYVIVNVVYFVLSILLWHELMYLIGLLSFWLIQMWPLEPIINAFYLFLGGLLFPLSLLPHYFYEVVRFSPFSLVSSDLIQVVLNVNNVNLSNYIYIFSIIVWYLLLRFFSIMLFKNGIKKFEGVGI